MDERQVRALLSEAADGVHPSVDLAARARRRYLQRRARIRALAAAVVIVVIGSAFAAATLVGRERDATPVVGPAPTTTTTGPAPTTTNTVAPTGAVPVTGALRSLSFVDANVGFGLSGTNLVSTHDGGRTWRRVGPLVEGEPWLHFESAKNGVAWGNGPLEVTTDGGVHWKTSTGPVDNDLAWSSGRLWALTPCLQTTPCGSRPALISDDAGTTWTLTAPLRMGFGGATIVPTSRSTAYVLEPSGDTPGSQLRIALTNDGGSSWSYESVPCTVGNDDQLSSNGRSLLLMCSDATAAGVMELRHLLVSRDEGKSWARLPDQRVLGNAGELTNLGTIYMTGMGRSSAGVSSDDGRSWKLPFPLPAGGGVSFTSLPGVGAWAAVGGAGGIWFSADGLHWAQRAGGA